MIDVSFVITWNIAKVSNPAMEEEFPKITFLTVTTNLPNLGTRHSQVVVMSFFCRPGENVKFNFLASC